MSMLHVYVIWLCCTYVYVICLYMPMYIYLSIYLPTYLSIYLPTYLSTYPSIHPSIYLSLSRIRGASRRFHIAAVLATRRHFTTFHRQKFRGTHGIAVAQPCSAIQPQATVMRMSSSELQSPSWPPLISSAQLVLHILIILVVYPDLGSAAVEICWIVQCLSALYW